MERPVEEIVRTLEEGQPKERIAAAAQLVDRCRADPATRERYLMRFVTLLADDSPAIRGEAAIGVVVCDEKGEHVDRVARLLRDPKPGVRLQAAHVLASLGLPELRDRLAGALADEDVLVRVAVASALADAGDRRGIPALVEAVDHKLARIDALLALGRLAAPEGEAPARRILGKLFAASFDRVAAASVLAALGYPEGGKYLVARADKRRAADRQMAIELLGERKVAGAGALLKAIAGRPGDPGRGPALRAWASLGEDDGRAEAARVLVDEREDPDVRMDAAEGLLLAGREADRAALERAAASDDEHVREVAREALELFGRPAAEVRLHLPLGEL